MKVSNALYTYPVLSVAGLRDDFIPESSFSVLVEKRQTGVSEVSLDVVAELMDDNLTALIRQGKAKIICHLESPLTSHRATREVNPFDMRVSIPIDPENMRGTLEVTPFIAATRLIDDYSSDTFAELYQGSYRIEPGDVLAFAPTVEVEIEPEDIEKSPTQSIIRVSSHDGREMTTDLTGAYILVRLPKETYSGYKMLSRKESSHHKLSLMAVVLPALMDAIFEMKSGDGHPEDKIWSRVIRAKLKAGGRGSDVSKYDPLVHAQYLLNNPADGTFEPIIDSLGDDR
jgi:hypothetical protein